MKTSRLIILAFSALATATCGSSTPTTPGVSGAKLTAPVASAPADQAQLATLRPTLSVTNGTSDTAGGKTYEFQVSDRSDFSTTSNTGAFPVLARQTGVAETANTTSYTPDFDMQPATRLYWRARLVQGAGVSDWSATRSFNTAIVGYNKANELYDPLVNGNTIGTIAGSTTFLPGQGIKLNDKTSYVRYQLVTPISAGEYSVEIAGLSPNGPGPKLKLFSMSDSTASVYDSPWLFTVQYRGVGGNPDNCISWKMRLSDPAFQLEPDSIDRNKYVLALDPAHFYYFRAMWNDGFRMIIQTSVGSGTFYDLEYASTEYFVKTGILKAIIPYAPNPHFAYIGANNQREGPEDGTWPGEIVRNVFISNKPRPASLGSALRPQQ